MTMNKNIRQSDLRKGQKKVPSLRSVAPPRCCNTCPNLNGFMAMCEKHNLGVYGDFLCDDHPEKKEENKDGVC